MSRLGEAWELDLDDDGFRASSFEEGNVIVFYVVGKSQFGWRCVVVQDTPFEKAGDVIDRPELAGAVGGAA